MSHLRVWRPSTADLILTKMMRIDPQDRADIEFLRRQADVSAQGIREAVAQAVLPEIPEIYHAFASNRDWLLSLPPL